MKKLTVLGSVNADHVLYMKQFPKPGETLVGHGYQVIPGGKGANQAVAAARMRGQTCFIASVGDDDFGKQMLDYFKREGLDTRGVIVQKGMSTGVAMIQVNEQGENCICLSAEANSHLTVEQLMTCQSLILDADMLLMQLEIPMETVISAAQIAHSSKSNSRTKVILNPAPAQPLSDELLALVDMITPNETEAEILTGIAVQDEQSAQQAANWLHQKGIPSVLITMGARGVFWSESSIESLINQGQPVVQRQMIPSFHVAVKDTTAAGDTFNAALLSELLNGAKMTDAIRFAHAAAAISVTRLGAQCSIPKRLEVLDFLDKQV